MADDSQTPSAPLAEISHGPSPFELFLDRHQKSLLVLLILATLAVAGYVVYQGIEDGTRTTAGNALYQAADADALQKVISEYPETPAASTAHILLAEKQWDEGKKDASIQTLRSFLANAPGHPGMPSAKAALAAKLMAQGKAAEAASAFEEIIEDNSCSYLAPFALLCLGDMALAGGDKEKAKSYFEKSKTEFPDSGFNQKITERIAALNASPPVQIDPPPPPKESKPATPSFPVPYAPGATPQEINLPSGSTTIPSDKPSDKQPSNSSGDQS